MSIENDRVANSGAAMREALHLQSGIPASLLQNAECVIVVPSTVKFAVGVGGTGGVRLAVTVGFPAGIKSVRNRLDFLCHGLSDPYSFLSEKLTSLSTGLGREEYSGRNTDSHVNETECHVNEIYEIYLRHVEHYRASQALINWQVLQTVTGWMFLDLCSRAYIRTQKCSGTLPPR